MKKRFNVKLAVAVVGMLFLSIGAFAQSHNNDCDQTSAPFDGGISLLVAAGIGYASKKAVDKRKKQEEAKKF